MRRSLLRKTRDDGFTEMLIDILKPKKVLLLLDNCEHLVGACAHLAAMLLRACPALKILATSREALKVAGEQPWRVPPMAHPSTEHLHSVEKEFANSLLEYDACRLFVERARLQQPEFALTTRNALVLAHLCERLDGMPLALELAAARMRVLTMEQLYQRLSDRFSLLSDGARTVLARHQTLRALIDWSYELLAPEEQKLLGRLSVFAGGWALEAAEAVCADFRLPISELRSPPSEEPIPIENRKSQIETPEVLDLLTSLVDKSLVVFEAERETGGRYHLLETIRQYTQERLEESEETATWRDRHRDYFLALAEEAEPQLSGPEQAVWLQRLEVEHDNLRAALTWCQAEQDGAEAGLRLAGALGRFWEVRGHVREGRMYMEEALRREGAAGTTKERAKALNQAGWLAHLQGDLEAARALYEQSLTICRELGDKQGIASALNGLGRAAEYEGNYALAGSFYEQSLQLARELGDKYHIAWNLHGLGFVAYRQDESARARSLLEQSVEIFRAMEHRLGTARSLERFGELAVARGQMERAGRLFGAGTRLRDAIGSVMSPSVYESTLAVVREALGEEAFAAAWSEGQAMSLEQAIDYALKETIIL